MKRFSIQVGRGVANLLSAGGQRGRLAVFCYHGVLEKSDRWRVGEPDQHEFAGDVEVIMRTFNVLPLVEAGRRMCDGTLPARAASITFDDGYANNHQLAAPILEKAGATATFFVAGGAIDSGIMWNDLVIEAAAAAGDSFELGGVAGLGGAMTTGRAHHSSIDRVLEQLKYLPLDRREAAAQQIYDQNAAVPPPRLMMTREMVADLAAHGFDIGAHTIRHPILQKLPQDQARREIEGSRNWIKEVTGEAPAAFAYPNGMPGTDFGPEHVRMVQETGFQVAVTTRWGVHAPAGNPLEIPRLSAWWRQGRSLPIGLLRAYVKSYLGI